MMTGGSLSLILSSGLLGCIGEMDQQTLATPSLLTTLWDAETIAAIGALYRSRVPNEDDREGLVKLLSHTMPTDREALLNALDRAIKEDYRNGNIITLDGWIMSVTEARQCALFSLWVPN